MTFPRTIRLNSGRVIGADQPTYIIAEIGSNHDGSLETAQKMIQLAKDCGADAAKFQSFQSHTLLNPKKYDEGRWVDHPATPILEKLALPEDWHAKLQKLCREVGIDFASAPFDEERLALLDRLDVPWIKLASGEVTNLPFLKDVAALKRPVILSTAASTLGEVETALATLASHGCLDVVVMHCVSAYPTPFEDANIRAMVTIANAFGCLVGYSDHTPGSTVPVGAVALGACVIEKHLTYDTKAPGPDHPFALDGQAFKAMVDQVRELEKALGDGRKQAMKSDESSRVGGRRAMYAQQRLAKGTVLSAEHVKVVREAYPIGIPADMVHLALGHTLSQDVEPHTLLTWDMLSSSKVTH